MESLDNNFDVVVVGTGLGHSILAAALARAGKRVCHLDGNEFYGGFWSSMNLKDFLSWAGGGWKKHITEMGCEFDFNITIPTPFSAKHLKACYSPRCRGKGVCYSPSCSDASWKVAWSAVLQKARSFSIDLRYVSSILTLFLAHTLTHTNVHMTWI